MRQQSGPHTPCAALRHTQPLRTKDNPQCSLPPHPAHSCRSIRCPFSPFRPFCPSPGTCRLRRPLIHEALPTSRARLSELSRPTHSICHHSAPPHTSPEGAADSAQGQPSLGEATLGFRTATPGSKPSTPPHPKLTSSVCIELRLAPAANFPTALAKAPAK